MKTGKFLFEGVYGFKVYDISYSTYYEGLLSKDLLRFSDIDNI